METTFPPPHISSFKDFFVMNVQNMTFPPHIEEYTAIAELHEDAKN